MHTFTYQKTLLHRLLLLVFKIVESLQCILKCKKVVIEGSQRGKTCFLIFGRFFSKCIFLTECYDHQTFQGGDMLRGALTHIYARHLNRVVFWGHVKNKIHISTCRRCIDTTLDKELH